MNWWLLYIVGVTSPQSFLSLKHMDQYIQCNQWNHSTWNWSHWWYLKSFIYHWLNQFGTVYVLLSSVRSKSLTDSILYHKIDTMRLSRVRVRRYMIIWVKSRHEPITKIKNSSRFSVCLFYKHQRIGQLIESNTNTCPVSAAGYSCTCVAAHWSKHH